MHEPRSGGSISDQTRSITCPDELEQAIDRWMHDCWRDCTLISLTFFPANNILQVDSCRLQEPAFGRYSLDIHIPIQLCYVEFDTQHNQRTNARADSSNKATDWRTETCGRSTAAKSISCMIRSSARTSISVSSGRVQKKTNIVLSFPSIFQGTQKLQRGTLFPRTTSSRSPEKKNYR